MEGLPDNIGPTKTPKIYKDTHSRVDAVEWMAAYNKEYQGMMGCGAVRVAVPPLGTRVLGTTTRLEYRTDKG